MSSTHPFEQAFAQSANGSLPERVQSERAEARAWWASHDLPTPRVEEWKYTSLRDLDKHQFVWQPNRGQINSAKIRELMLEDTISLVLVDGRLDREFSKLDALPRGLSIGFLSEGDEQSHRFGFDQHPFKKLNQALFDDALTIRLEEQAVIEQPIHIIHWQTSVEEQAKISAPRIAVNAGSSSQITLLETFAGEPAPNLTAACAAYHLSPNAQVRLYRSQLEDQATFHFSTTKVDIERDARCEFFNLATGGRLSRADIEVNLVGEGAEVGLDGVYCTTENQHVDFHTSICHSAANARSSQLYKGILAGGSRAVFNGKVIVNKGAQQTSAFQLNKNLLLGDGAEVDTKPELQIDADDVKCSHGATVGQLNEDEIFYLRSRAIPLTQAKAMLCKAYVSDVILNVQSDLVGRWLSDQVDEFFGRVGLG